MKSSLTYQDIEAAFHASRRRVLCMDENTYFLTGVCHFLATCGHEAVKATIARTALDLIQADPTRFDALLLADPLYDTNTLELAEALLAAGYQGKIMIKSENLSSIRREHFQAMGIQTFVPVPVDLYKLLSQVETAARLSSVAAAQPTTDGGTTIPSSIPVAEAS
jgi:DNA-binding response OmpR family regulator